MHKSGALQVLIYTEKIFYVHAQTACALVSSDGDRRDVHPEWRSMVATKRSWIDQCTGRGVYGLTNRSTTPFHGEWKITTMKLGLGASTSSAMSSSGKRRNIARPGVSITKSLKQALSALGASINFELGNGRTIG